MKKALDYVGDYQLNSACKDAICICICICIKLPKWFLLF